MTPVRRVQTDVLIKNGVRTVQVLKTLRDDSKRLLKIQKKIAREELAGRNHRISIETSIILGCRTKPASQIAAYFDHHPRQHKSCAHLLIEQSFGEP